MKKLCLIIALLSNISTSAQEIELVGLLKQESGQSFLISLNFVADSLGAFSGTTTVDPFGPYKTITSVKGLLQEDALIFTEIGNLETSIDDTSQRYCFIQSNALVATKKGDMTYFKGTYTGYDLNGIVCSEGEIQLSPKSSLKSKTAKKLIRTIAKTEQMSKSPAIKESFNAEKREKSRQEVANRRKILKSSEPILLHENNENLDWYSHSLKVHLKDSYDEDGDIVAVLKNGELISEIELSKKGESLDFHLDGDKIVLRILALHEGYSPPTTLDIMLYDEYCIYRSSIRLEQNQWTEITLNLDIKD
jgi:hypothetical protein